MANRWVADHIDDINNRPSRPPKFPRNLQRPADIMPDELNDIFAWQELRKLSNTLAFQYEKIINLVESTDESTRVSGERVPSFFVILNYSLAFFGFLHSKL
jgi:hypothetical protein